MTTEKIALTPEIKAKVKEWHDGGATMRSISDRTGLSIYHVRKIVDPEMTRRHNSSKDSAEKKPKMVRVSRAAIARSTVEIPSLYILDLHSRGFSITRIGALTRQPYQVVYDVIKRARAV